MRTRTVEYENGETTYRIVVTEATALVGMKRTILRGAAQSFIAGLRSEADVGEGEAADKVARSALDVSALSILAVVVYPALLSAASEMEGIDAGISVEEFAALPDALMDAWEAATYELNPHWLPQPEPEDDDEAEVEKKAPSDDASVSAPA